MTTQMKLNIQVLRRTAAFLMEDGNVHTHIGSIARQVIALNGVIDRLSALRQHGRTAVTTETGPELSRARNILGLLDALVAPQLRGTDRLARWKTLCRNPRRARHRRRRGQPLRLGHAGEVSMA